MEESAPKRRRTSPSNDDRPEDAPTQRTSPRRRRPSWASPTKASMSRHNPEILERRRSASPPKPTSPTRQPADTRTSTTTTSARAGMQQSNTQPPPVGRSPSRPSPRPLPPPAPDGDDDFNPFAGHTLRRSPRTGVNIPPPPEPELPPSVADAVSSTPPRGIHSSSSPSRRRSRARPSAASMAGSPLKQPPSYPGPDPADEAQPQPARKTLFAGPAQPQQPPSRLAAVLGETTYNVRRLPAPGTDPVKTKERDALREELARLRRDLDVTARQNERIRAMQAAGRRVALSDEDQVVDILRRHLLPEEAGDANKQKQSTALAKAALDPMALVGFGRSTATSAVPAADEAIDLSDIKSHHPLPMTAEEELPFLQLFTPFDMTPTLSLARGTGGASGKSPRQLFSLRLRSRDCPGLFTARVDVIVDAARMSIQSVEVAGLEPAARAELGPFLDRVCAGECNRSMQRNVGIVAWAMAEWLRVAERRARFWAQLHAQTGTAKRLRDMARSVRAAKRSRRSRDRDSADTDEGAVSVAVADLLRFMGEQSYDVQIPGQEQTSLRLTWGITFDWTGEAKSKVAVMVGVPGKWHHADAKGAFGRLPSLFEKLVEGGEEPGVAVRKMIALLVGES